MFRSFPRDLCLGAFCAFVCRIGRVPKRSWFDWSRGRASSSPWDAARSVLVLLVALSLRLARIQRCFAALATLTGASQRSRGAQVEYGKTRPFTRTDRPCSAAPGSRGSLGSRARRPQTCHDEPGGQTEGGRVGLTNYTRFDRSALVSTSQMADCEVVGWFVWMVGSFKGCWFWCLSW